MPSVYQRRASTLDGLEQHVTMYLVSAIEVGLHSAAEPDGVQLDVRHVVNKRNVWKILYEPKFVPTKMQFEHEQTKEYLAETNGLRSASDAENSTVQTQAKVAKAKLLGTLQNLLS